MAYPYLSSCFFIREMIFLFNVGDYLVYSRDICKIIKIEEKKYNNNDYYILTQVNDKSLKREVLVKSDKIRPLILKNKIQKIINQIPEIPVIEVINDKMFENEYRKLFISGKHEDLIKIIKTSYLRNKEKIDNDKKISAIDEKNLQLAEKYLYTEISIVLGISCDEVKKIIVDKILQS